MLVERTSKEVIIRLPASVDTEDLQDFLNYARYKELTANFKTDQAQVDKLANDINAKWWTKNRQRFSFLNLNHLLLKKLHSLMNVLSQKTF